MDPHRQYCFCLRLPPSVLQEEIEKEVKAEVKVKVEYKDENVIREERNLESGI